MCQVTTSQDSKTNMCLNGIMIKFIKITILLTSTLFVFLRIAFAHGSFKPTEPFPLPVPAAPGNTITSEIKDPLKEYCTRLENRIYQNWETTRSAEKPTPIVVTFTLNSAGEFSNIQLKNSSGGVQEDFDVMEAVAETSGVLKTPPIAIRDEQITITLVKTDKITHFDCVDLQRKKHPDLDQTAVVMHLIPAEALQSFPNLPANIVPQPTQSLFFKEGVCFQP
jgi:TonB C terminal